MPRLLIVVTLQSASHDGSWVLARDGDNVGTLREFC